MFRSALAAAAVALFATAVPTVKVSVVKAGGTSPGDATIAVRLEASDLTLGAYQGTLHYTPGAFSIVSASAPSGDGTRVVNPADSAKGIIRFAGYTVSLPFKSNDVLILVVRSTKALDQAGITAELQVAGDLVGNAVAKDHLIPARGLSASTSGK